MSKCHRMITNSLSLPERWPLSNVPFDLIVTIFPDQAVILHSYQKEAILVLAILFALVLAVVDIESLQW
jgi:hypothetical protein